MGRSFGVDFVVDMAKELTSFDLLNVVPLL